MVLMMCNTCNLLQPGISQNPCLLNVSWLAIRQLAIKQLNVVLYYWLLATVPLNICKCLVVQMCQPLLWATTVENSK